MINYSIVHEDRFSKQRMQYSIVYLENIEKLVFILKVLQEMLDHIDRQQRNKLKLDNLSIPSPERHRPLRHQYSSDNMHVPPFNIPNLRIDQRKTSSAEDMARKNSTGIDRLLF